MGSFKYHMIRLRGVGGGSWNGHLWSWVGRGGGKQLIRHVAKGIPPPTKSKKLKIFHNGPPYVCGQDFWIIYNKKLPKSKKLVNIEKLTKVDKFDQKRRNCPNSKTLIKIEKNWSGCALSVVLQVVLVVPRVVARCKTAAQLTARLLMLCPNVTGQLLTRC